MIQLNGSLQHRHQVLWSGDPALTRPKIAAGVTEEEHAASLAAWEDTFRVARETGDYTPVVRPGEQPALFTVAPLTRSINDAFLDALAAGRIGQWSLFTLAFRLCVKAIDKVQGLELKFDEEPITGRKAIKADLVDELEAAAPGVVREIGRYILDRGVAPPGK